MAEIDARCCCKFCYQNDGSLVQAHHIAPQHTGGDMNVPATWVPVCQSHFRGWYIDVVLSQQLPSFDLDWISAY